MNHIISRLLTLDVILIILMVIRVLTAHNKDIVQPKELYTRKCSYEDCIKDVKKDG